MRKRTAVISIIIMSLGLALSGCGVAYPELNEDQNDMIAEYSVSLLLKYDEDNHSRLIDTTPFMDSYNEAVRVREDGIRQYEEAKAAEEEARRKETEAQEASMTFSEEDNKEERDGTGGATVIDETFTPSVSLETFLHADNYSIIYAGNDLVSSYPEDGTDFFFSMDATKGNRLLIVYFNVTNHSEAGRLDVMNENATFKLSVNGDSYKSVFKSMLEDDMGEYIGNFNAGETKRLVLVTEVPEGTAISSLDLMVYNKGGDRTEIALAD